MIRRKIWATATCCLALAGAAKAQTGTAPKASLGTPKADSGYIARGQSPGYPQYTPRNYLAPTPPGYAAPVANLGTSPAPGPMAPPAPLPMVEQPMMVGEFPVDPGIQFAADTVPTVPVPVTAAPMPMTPAVMPGTPMGSPMVMEGTPVPTGPLVTGPINGGPIVEGSFVSSTPFLDGYLSGPMPNVWVSGEYLNWRTRGAHFPALVTTAPVGGSGTLSDPSTAVLFGGTDRQSDWQSGFRVRAGTWVEGGQSGFDVGFFALGRMKDRFATGSNGDPGVFRPFFNTFNGAEDAALVAFVDPVAGRILSGRVSILSETQLWGAEANYRTGWTTGLGGRFDALLGYRYVRLKDTISIQSDLTTAVAAGAAPAGTLVDINDRFEGLNQFHGGQVGLVGEWQMGSMTFGLRASVAAGVNLQTVDISGASGSQAPGAARIGGAGGLYALSSNIGSHERTVFSVVPEVGATIGYQVTSSLRVFGGYNVMSFTNVVRGAEQIDRRVNGTFIPDPTTGTASGSGAASPLFRHRDSDFYVHGWTAGLEWRW